MTRKNKTTKMSLMRMKTQYLLSLSLETLTSTVSGNSMSKEFKDLILRQTMILSLCTRTTEPSYWTILSMNPSSGLITINI